MIVIGDGTQGNIKHIPCGIGLHIRRLGIHHTLQCIHRFAGELLDLGQGVPHNFFPRARIMDFERLQF